MTDGGYLELSALEFHVMLALVAEPLYGYAIKEAVVSESSGALQPHAGSLYRVLARLMQWKLVTEIEAEPDAPPHPGLARKYYALTPRGRKALGAAARRLKQSARLAEERLGIVVGGR
ncbi:MAG: PadR family transcriptional regulator [Gemmatimonadota bacterium]